MTRLFGTDGIRGVANEEPLTPELAYRVGRQLVATLQAEHGVERVRLVLGRDTRRSGPLLEAALTAGALSAGADCYAVGVLPTPGHRVADAHPGGPRRRRLHRVPQSVRGQRHQAPHRERREVARGPGGRDRGGPGRPGRRPARPAGAHRPPGDLRSRRGRLRRVPVPPLSPRPPRDDHRPRLRARGHLSGGTAGVPPAGGARRRHGRGPHRARTSTTGWARSTRRGSRRGWRSGAPPWASPSTATATGSSPSTTRAPFATGTTSSPSPAVTSPPRGVCAATSW